MRTYLIWHNDVPNVPNVPVNTPLYWPYPQGGTCEALRLAFLGLSVADRISQSSTVQPSSSTGWRAMNCGGSTSVDSLWVLDTDSGDSFLSDSGSSQTLDTTDQAGETNQTIYTSNQNIS